MTTHFQIHVHYAKQGVSNCRGGSYAINRALLTFEYVYISGQFGMQSILHTCIIGSATIELEAELARDPESGDQSESSKLAWIYSPYHIIQS